MIKVPTRKKKKGAVQRNASVGSENSVGVASTEGGEVEEVRSERVCSVCVCVCVCLCVCECSSRFNSGFKRA